MPLPIQRKRQFSFLNRIEFFEIPNYVNGVINLFTHLVRKSCSSKQFQLFTPFPQGELFIVLFIDFCCRVFWDYQFLIGES